MSKPVELLRGRQGRWFGTLCMALGLLSVTFGLYSGLNDSASSVFERCANASIPVLVGALLVSGGYMLAQRRGGLFRTASSYQFFGDSEADLLDIPFESIGAMHTWELQERFGEVIHPRWVIEICLKSGVRVLMGESDDEHGLKTAAHTFLAGTPLAPFIETEPVPVEIQVNHSQLPETIRLKSPTEVHLKIGPGGTLARTLLTGGPSMLVVGTLLMSDVGNNHVFGFLFGPLFFALGFALTAVPLYAALTDTMVDISDTQITAKQQFGSFIVSDRSIPRSAKAYVRIRQRGLLGAGLEVVSDGHVLLVCNGAHESTRITPHDLLNVASWLHSRLHTS